MLFFFLFNDYPEYILTGLHNHTQTYKMSGPRLIYLYYHAFSFFSQVAQALKLIQAIIDSFLYVVNKWTSWFAFVSLTVYKVFDVAVYSATVEPSGMKVPHTNCVFIKYVSTVYTLLVCWFLAMLASWHWGC